MSTKKFGSNVDFTKIKNLGNPTHVSVPTQQITKQGNTTMSLIARWGPLLLAGTAIGVSVMAIKEIKTVRKELTSLKTGSVSNVDLHKKMELMDGQLKQITAFISQQSSNKPVLEKQKKSSFKGNTVKFPTDVKIINDSRPSSPSSPSKQSTSPTDKENIKNVSDNKSVLNIPEVKENNTITINDIEYEEVEVTDDESEADED
jgi:hypothetical protein